MLAVGLKGLLSYLSHFHGLWLDFVLEQGVSKKTKFFVPYFLP